MAFDIERIQRELAAAPILSPWEPDLGTAIADDLLRLAGKAPLDWPVWKQWSRKRGNTADQVGMIGWALASSSLRDETRPLVDGIDEVEKRLDRFFHAISPLDVEMIRANRHRQEEFLRRWIEIWNGEIVGETAEESAAALDRLDYKKTLAEYQAAEKARQAEEKRREQLLREAEERAAAARGWRE